MGAHALSLWSLESNTENKRRLAEMAYMTYHLCLRLVFSNLLYIDIIIVTTSIAKVLLFHMAKMC
jgi:hypothetical protein